MQPLEILGALQKVTQDSDCSKPLRLKGVSRTRGVRGDQGDPEMRRGEKDGVCQGELEGTDTTKPCILFAQRGGLGVHADLERWPKAPRDTARSN